jgi:hypothetical protein
MRRHVLVLASLVAACGIDAVGQLVSGAPPDRDDEEADADAPAIAPDGSGDAGVDVVEAGPRCDASFVVSDPLSVIDLDTWIVIADGTNVGYPAVETTAEGPAIALLAPGAGTNLGAMYLAQPLAMRAFDVKVRSLVTCPDAGGCSDGLAFTWLAPPDGGTAGLQTFTSTPTFGIPANAPGAGVAFDLQTDVGPNDPAAPSVALLAIDGVGLPGAYDWHTKSAAAPTFAGNRDITLSLRKGQITVKVDGAPAIDGPISADAGAGDAGFVGYFGMSASNGAAIGRFALRSFSATFYECDDP